MPKSVELKITNDYSFGDYRAIEVELDDESFHKERARRRKMLADLMHSLDVDAYIKFAQENLGYTYTSRYAVLYLLHSLRAKPGKGLRKHLSEGETRISKRWLKEHKLDQDDPDFYATIKDVWE